MENAEMGLRMANGRKARGLGREIWKFARTPRSALIFTPISMMAIKHASGSDAFASWPTAMSDEHGWLKSDDDAPAVEHAGKLTAVGVGLCAKTTTTSNWDVASI
jgi:hypothetical protein